MLCYGSRNSKWSQLIYSKISEKEWVCESHFDHKENQKSHSLNGSVAYFILVVYCWLGSDSDREKLFKPCSEVYGHLCTTADLLWETSNCAVNQNWNKMMETFHCLLVNQHITSMAYLYHIFSQQISNDFFILYEFSLKIKGRFCWFQYSYWNWLPRRWSIFAWSWSWTKLWRQHGVNHDLLCTATGVLETDKNDLVNFPVRGTLAIFFVHGNGRFTYMTSTPFILNQVWWSWNADINRMLWWSQSSVASLGVY